jgi:membrane-associated phospholipid phosphatase
MNASTVYGGITVRKDMPAALRITTAIVIVLVAFSRLYLGVHTPQDVVVGIAAGMLVMWLIYKMMQWIDSYPEKDWLVVLIGIVLAAAVAIYAALKPYPEDFDAQGKLLVDGAKMANDTFKGVGWCIAYLIGWVLERRYVGFSTEISVPRKLTRIAIGLFIYYAVSLILVPQIKVWISGPAGTIVSCFLQMFYVSFIFPWCIKVFGRKQDV